MCSSTPPRMFNLAAPAGVGNGSTTSPATVYASSANPALVDAGSPTPGTAPAAPKAKKVVTPYAQPMGA